MRLYRENGVNPLGGCLPLLAQMPMFFALFSVLRGIADWKPGTPTPYGMTESVVQSAQQANILGAHISDKVLFTGTLHVPLEAKIVILCAVAISVTTTFLTVRQSTKRGMTPAMTPDNPMAASQKYMAYIVPFFALSGLYWAFGLVLYWVTTNVWTLGQQYVLFKRYPTPVPGTASAPGGAAPAAPAAPAKPAAVSRLTAAKSVTSGKPSTAASPTRIQARCCHREAGRYRQARCRRQARCHREACHVSREAGAGQEHAEAARGPAATEEAAEQRVRREQVRPVGDPGRAAGVGERLGRQLRRPAAAPGAGQARARATGGDTRR